MSADLLRRAADKLERLAAPMSGERWDYDKFSDVEPWLVHLDTDPSTWPDAGDIVPTVATLTEDCESRDRGAWIAAMSPQTAAPLVAWLRCLAADWAEREHEAHILGEEAPEGGPAVAFARVILGEQP